MIFYFSGTGNSLYVAKVLGINLGQPIEDISFSVRKGQKRVLELGEEEPLGFVFPVYAWGPPSWVINFIKQMEIKHSVEKPPYIFAIATCGENIGKSLDSISSALREKGHDLDYGYSIKMPNNYVIFGRGGDTGQRAEDKIRRGDLILDRITQDVKGKGRGFCVEKGKLATWISPLANTLFNKMAINTKKFRVNENCTACEICVKVCNTQTIMLEENRPIWGSDCVQCLACINLCPEKAIDYGKSTQKKQRYKNPRISAMELMKK